MRLFHVPPQDGFPNTPVFAVSPANYFDWKRDAKLFDSMAIFRFRQFRLTGGSTAESIVAAAVGAGFFRVFNAQPALGRTFLEEEDSPDRCSSRLPG